MSELVWKLGQIAKNKRAYGGLVVDTAKEAKDRIVALEAKLDWALHYGDFESVLDGNPLMKQVYDAARALLGERR